MSEEVKGQLAPVTKPAAFMVPKEWGFPTMGGEYFTSLREEIPAEKQMIFRCLAEPGLDVNEWINRPLSLSHFLCCPAEWVTEETGEINRTIVTRLITDNGLVIETHSKGVLKTLLLICNHLSPPPWSPPLSVQITSKPLSGEKRWLILEVVRPEQTPKKEGKGR